MTTGSLSSSPAVPSVETLYEKITPNGTWFLGYDPLEGDPNGLEGGALG